MARPPVFFSPVSRDLKVNSFFFFHVVLLAGEGGMGEMKTPLKETMPAVGGQAMINTHAPLFMRMRRSVLLYGAYTGGKSRARAGESIREERRRKTDVLFRGTFFCEI